MATAGTMLIPIGLLDDSVQDMVVQNDGKIILVGDTSNGSNLDVAIARLNVDGTLDPSFGSGGKLVVQFGNSNETGWAVALNSFGEILVSGTGKGLTGFPLVRLLSDGSRDPSFGVNGIAVAAGISTNVTVNIGGALTVLPSGNTVSAGYATSFTGSGLDSELYVFKDNGRVDTTVRGSIRDILNTTLNPGGNGKVTVPVSTANSDYATSVVALADGRFVLGGYVGNGGNSDFYAARLKADGSSDTTFGAGGIAKIQVGNGNDVSYDSTLQSDGKLLLAGTYVNSLGDYDPAMVRLTSTGQLDSSFGVGGKVTVPIPFYNAFYRIAVQSDGKIVAVGGGFNGDSSNAFLVYRFTSSGILDGTFGSGGVVNVPMSGSQSGGVGLAITANGQILVSGTAFNGFNNDMAIVRLNSNGIIDSTFGIAGQTVAGLNLTGTSANETFPTSAGNDTINGGAGIDTVAFSGYRASYSINKTASGWSVVDNTGRDGTDTVQNVERLRYSDGGIALDLGVTQSAGQTQLLLGAVLGKDLLATKKQLIGTVIDLFDQGFTLQQLSGALMRLDIWGLLANAGQPGASNVQIANYLLTTVNGLAPDSATLVAGVNSLNTEIGAAQGNFLWHLAESAANQAQVGLVGLTSTGLEFIY